MGVARSPVGGVPSNGPCVVPRVQKQGPTKPRARGCLFPTGLRRLHVEATEPLSHDSNDDVLSFAQLEFPTRKDDKSSIEGRWPWNAQQAKTAFVHVNAQDLRQASVPGAVMSPGVGGMVGTAMATPAFAPCSGAVAAALAAFFSSLLSLGGSFSFRIRFRYRLRSGRTSTCVQKLAGTATAMRPEQRREPNCWYPQDWQPLSIQRRLAG